MTRIFLARQPIVDRDRRVHAYEILFRANAKAVSCEEKDGDRATASVVLSSITGLGLDRITTGRLAFINCTERVLMLEGLHQVLHPKTTVLEVLESVEPRPLLISGLRTLARQGYRIALDDFTYRPGLEPFLEVAHYVKVDLRATSPQELREAAKRRKSHGYALVAEKVETYDEFRQCSDLGFDYFQGWFFCKAETLESHAPVTSRVTAIQLLARLHEKNAEIDKIVRLVKLDPQLSYSVLRIANSAVYACPVPVESVHEAIMRVGMGGLRRWVSIMLMARLDDKPAELLVTAVIRARMCEILGTRLGANADSLFTTGLFSVLEALFDRPLAEILATVPLPTTITDALWLRPGTAGEILQAVLAHEQGSLKVKESKSALSQALVTQAWLEAFGWTRNILNDLGISQPSRASTPAPALTPSR